ncbi:MAG: 3-oxoacyl-ACP reductase FabG [Bryobacteraceae bacterium]
MSTALVTGGSRGIGRGIVEALAAAGHKVAFTYASNHEAAAVLVRAVEAAGGAARAFPADVKDFARAKEVFAEIAAGWEPVTILVNNAGIRKDGAFHSMDPAAWQDVIDTNLGGTFHYSRAVIGDMIRRGGSIINISSVSGVIGLAGQTNYSASKAGVIGFTKALGKEVARFGIRVNAIAPGFIETDMTETIDAEVRKKLYAQIPMKRPGTVEDISKMVVYLASDAAAYITGQVLTIDGGLS